MVLNKADLLDEPALAALESAIAGRIPRAVKLLRTTEGRLEPDVLLGQGACAEDDLQARPSHHDAADGAHEHDDFDSFVVPLGPVPDAGTLLARLHAVTAAHDVLRMKGFAALDGRPMRLAVQGVGTRFRHQFDRPWAPGEDRAGAIVVIGRTGMDRDAIAAIVRGG